MSEKSYALSQQADVYVFKVPKSANKLMVAKAVADQFKVSVTAVNMTVIKGKAKRSPRKNGRPVLGRASDLKKAYVSLKKGDKLPIFDSVEEEEKKEEKIQKAVTTAQEKQVAKETKKKRSIRSALGRAPRQVQNRGGDK
jgi:large subunit ribosomal protein L23